MLLKACALLLSAYLVLGCQGSEPVNTTLAVLSDAQSDFDGRRVMVSGTLKTHAEPRHYWIENDSFNRVALETAEDLAPWVGRTVKVRGTFFYDPDRGRRIQVEDMSAL